ncbi:MAG: carbon-nitrogen hydrolase, partial [Acidobacteria bacterium]|nr:carbon-nitrogen hydrolase [Acidobacteriota bacterium]
MRISLVQLSPTLGDIDANLALIEAEIERAAAHRAELAVFPELALTGYRLKDLVPHVALRLDRAGPVRDDSRRSRGKIPFVIGLVEETSEHRFFNAAAYWEDGQLVHVHRKCFLPTYGMFDERMDFSPGERLRCASTRLCRLGVLICEDVWHPAASTVLTQAGATLLIALSASPLRGLGSGGAGVLSDDSWQSLVCTMARFHTVPMLYVNRVGYEDGVAFAGRSFACGPGGEILAQAGDLDPEHVVVEIDPEATRAARAHYPLVRDERPQLIARELLRVAR